MGYEIELKVRVSEWESVERYLRDTCTFVREFTKSDRYFRSKTGTERDTSFRLRIDGEAAIVNFKTKELRDGIEFNRESEITVNDAGTFLELLGRTGSQEYATKVKSGLEFRHDGMTVELARVEQLGAFLEIEILETSADPAVQNAAAKKIRGFLAGTGISEEMIEPLSYVDLLRRDEVGKDAPGAL